MNDFHVEPVGEKAPSIAAVITTLILAGTDAPVIVVPRGEAEYCDFLGGHSTSNRNSSRSLHSATDFVQDRSQDQKRKKHCSAT